MKNFDDSPFIVIWEVTQACELACIHCRALAQPLRHPLELTTSEGIRLLHQIRDCGDPLVVFTGGDPLKRPDLFELLEISVSLGLRTTVTPSATPLLTKEAVGRFHSVGVARLAVSLDGASADSHDGFRRVEGSFDCTKEALQEAKRIGLPTQVNTTVTRHSMWELHEIADIVQRTGAVLWSVFFLVPTGRAQVEQDLTAQEYEAVFELLYGIGQSNSFDIKTTEAQHYRRYLAQQSKRNGRVGRFFGSRAIGRQAGINDGKGFLFVSHTGEIYPSGFLPLSAGNVRSQVLSEVYRNSPLFRRLRDSSGLGGKCGICEYRNLCGGSRSRAYALTRDYMAEEPRCAYEPKSGTVYSFPNSRLEGWTKSGKE
jgi:AdoMet-dependent heme synthase